MSTAAADWHVLPLERDAPERLLARSLALLDGLAQEPVPTLRWYRPTVTAVVLGRGQRRLEVTTSDGVRVVERSSGGGAVLLDEGMLALDVLLPQGDPWLSDDMGSVFAHVGGAWARALGGLGVPGLEVHDGPSTTPSRRAAQGRVLADVCYASVGRGEVLAGGRKLVGLSQRRRRHGTLVQCGLLRRWEPARLLAALGGDPTDAEILDAAVGLDDLLPHPPDDEAVAAALRTAFAERGAAARRRQP